MKSASYEPHKHDDPEFPVIFHHDKLHCDNNKFYSHWHESPEFLYVTRGEIQVLSDAHRIQAGEGAIVAINSNHIHNVRALSPVSEYHCLIVDMELCAQFGIDTETMSFTCAINDREAGKRFRAIAQELSGRRELYKPAAKAAIISFLVYLYRHHVKSGAEAALRHDGVKLETVKKSLKYMQRNFDKNISTVDIARHAGLSKFYFCRLFKEVTGYTVIYYLNLLRCRQAERLLLTTGCSIHEVSQMCGFDNFSYFSKTYKRLMGRLPSAAKDRKKQ